MRRIFALLAMASLSGCITDGPNKTGSEWLDDQDLGPKGYETVTLPASFLHIDTIAGPGVPAYSGLGSLIVGGGDVFSTVTSLWFDVKDSTRWILKRPDTVANRGWSLQVVLDTSCASGKVQLQMWKSDLDTGVFLLGLEGAGLSAPDYEKTAECKDDASGNVHSIEIPLGDSTVVAPNGRNFGIRLTAPGFASRVVSGVRVLNGVGDTLALGRFEGRSGWGVRTAPRVGALTSIATSSTRLRIRFDGEAMRNALRKALGADAIASDSFDNTFSVFSARLTLPLGSVTLGTKECIRLASWVVHRRDTTDLPFVEGATASKAFASNRDFDGKSMDGEMYVTGLKGGVARISLAKSGVSVPFYTTQNDTATSFHLLPGDSVEAPMYGDPGWTKFQFINDGSRVRFVRTVLSVGVAAEDQAESHNDYGIPTYREEAIVTPGQSKARIEARSAFARILNRKAQEVWTDLYSVSLSSDATLDGYHRIDLGERPIDSVTFIVRRRNLGVVE